MVRRGDSLVGVKRRQTAGSACLALIDASCLQRRVRWEERALSRKFEIRKQRVVEVKRNTPVQLGRDVVEARLQLRGTNPMKRVWAGGV